MRKEVSHYNRLINIRYSPKKCSRSPTIIRLRSNSKKSCFKKRSCSNRRIFRRPINRCIRRRPYSNNSCYSYYSNSSRRTNSVRSCSRKSRRTAVSIEIVCSNKKRKSCSKKSHHTVKKKSCSKKSFHRSRSIKRVKTFDNGYRRRVIRWNRRGSRCPNIIRRPTQSYSCTVLRKKSCSFEKTCSVKRRSCSERFNRPIVRRNRFA